MSKKLSFINKTTQPISIKGHSKDGSCSAHETASAAHLMIETFFKMDFLGCNEVVLETAVNYTQLKIIVFYCSHTIKACY